MDAVVVDAPRDLNFLWCVAHALGWCPYAVPDCPGFADPLVEQVGRAVAGIAHIGPTGAAARWERRVAAHAFGRPPWEGGEEAVWAPDPACGLEGALAIFSRSWGSLLGPSFALHWWVDRVHFGPVGAAEPTVSEWRQSTAVRTIAVVGFEDAVMRSGPLAVAGALAARSPGRLLRQIKDL